MHNVKHRASIMLLSYIVSVILFVRNAPHRPGRIALAPSRTHASAAVSAAVSGASTGAYRNVSRLFAARGEFRYAITFCHMRSFCASVWVMNGADAAADIDAGMRAGVAAAGRDISQPRASMQPVRSG